MSAATQALQEYEHTASAFEALKAEKLAQILATAPSQAAERETLYFQIKALDEVRDKLLSKASGAHIEAHLARLPEGSFSA